MENTTAEPIDKRIEHQKNQEVNARLLELLVCPVTHGPLDYDRQKQELISKTAKLAYPVRNGVPIMLPEEARSL